MRFDPGEFPITGPRRPLTTVDFEQSPGEKLNFSPIKDFINKVNDSQVKSDQSLEKFSMGEIDSIHKVIVDTQEALLSLKLATQIRNKAVEAYQEIMRMQI